jgi:uncharacterized membrane protein (UPF0127 family)
MRSIARKLGLLGLALASSVALAQQPSLPTTELSAGMHLIRAEVADNFGTRMQGLMRRPSMPANHGMLFVFDENDAHCMWMKNTLIALSVAFLDEQGTIINIEDMQPQTENSHCAKRPARFALEMNRGWFAQRGIKPGLRLRGLDKLGARRR